MFSTDPSLCLCCLFALIQQFLYTYLDSSLGCNGIVSYDVVAVIILVSGIVFSIVACKYRLRERDEVVNVHIFAEEYYGTIERQFKFILLYYGSGCMIAADLACSYVH